ncbi:MAG: tyrosine-type recombinase/integrase [Chthoniobacterales bacterium]
MKNTANETPNKTWEKTKVQNLVRHKSGRYYARAFANNKEIWKSLRTEHFSVAKARLAEFLRQYREKQVTSANHSSAKMTFDDTLATHLQNLDDNEGIKPSTRHYWRQVFKALLKSWPDLAAREVRRLTRGDCAEWARKFRKIASPTRYNNTVAGLRHVFDVAIEAGIVYGNPAAQLKRIKVRTKPPELPARADFLRLVETVERAGAWCSHDCADLLRGLAFTGCRKSEAAAIEWRDLDFEVGKIVVRGDPTTGTKNWTIRRVPMIPDARALFQRMRSERPAESLGVKVFRVNEAQKAIDSAARKLSLPRITHHHFRHLFATICIESGVDIPTVSHWLGHKDGGALAMKVYGHLRDDHSIAQAQRVSFAPVTRPPADVIPFPAATA